MKEKPQHWTGGRREAENPYPGSGRESFELLECCQEPRPECDFHSTDGSQKPGTWKKDDESMKLTNRFPSKI